MLQSSLHEIMISIHALREEGDLGLRYEGDNAKVFLSTPSARRATLVYGRQRRGKLISIHALREEGDGFPPLMVLTIPVFLSTPSARRATRT